MTLPVSAVDALKGKHPDMELVAGVRQGERAGDGQRRIG
jgi:hypothetical protein